MKKDVNSIKFSRLDIRCALKKATFCIVLRRSTDIHWSQIRNKRTSFSYIFSLNMFSIYNCFCFWMSRRGLRATMEHAHTFTHTYTHTHTYIHINIYTHYSHTHTHTHTHTHIYIYIYISRERERERERETVLQRMIWIFRTWRILWSNITEDNHRTVFGLLFRTLRRAPRIFLNRVLLKIPVSMKIKMASEIFSQRSVKICIK